MINKQLFPKIEKHVLVVAVVLLTQSFDKILLRIYEPKIISTFPWHFIPCESVVTLVASNEETSVSTAFPHYHNLRGRYHDYVVLGITSTEKKYLAKQKSEMVDFSSTSSLYEIFIECNILLNSFSSQRSDAQIHQMRESVKVLIFFYEMRH